MTSRSMIEVVINDQRYSSMAEAARALKLSRERIRQLVCIYGNYFQYPTQNANSKSCVWNGISYPSQTIAAQTLGIDKSILSRRLSKGQICDNDVRRYNKKDDR